MIPDALSPVAPARLRCLLVPAGRITKSRFIEFAKRLQDESNVRLGDVSPSSQPGRETFSPQAFPSGTVFYDLTVAEPTPGQRALYPFEISREPLVVLGLADSGEYTQGLGAQQPDNGPVNGKGTDTQALNLDLREALGSIQSSHPVARVHRILLFDHVSAKRFDLDGVTQIPSNTNASLHGLKTTMCDITSEVLSELAPYSKTIQGLSTIETPKQTMPEGYVRPNNTNDHEDSKRQSWFPGSSIRASSPNFSLGRLGNRASLPAHLFGSSSGGSSPSEEHPHSEASSPSVDNTATTFDQMRLQSPERRATGIDTIPDRVSVQGFGNDANSERGRTQGRGRVAIVVGSMYLVSGRWPDAVKELVKGGSDARSTNDHIWHAKAVDMILVALLLCAWAGIEFEIPPICLPIAERSTLLLGKTAKKSDGATNDVFVHQAASENVLAENAKTLANALPDIIQHIVRLYTRTTAEPVAQLVLSETFIRLSKLSTILMYCPDLGADSALPAIVLNQRLRTSDNDERILSLQSPAKAEISSLALAGLPAQGIQEMLQYSDRLAIHAGVAAVLGMIGYHRKKAFILRELLNFLLPALDGDDIDDHMFTLLPHSDTNGANGPGSGEKDSANELTDVQTNQMYDFLVQVCRVYGAVVIPASGELDKKSLSRFANGNGSEPETAGVDEAALLAARIENESLTRGFGSRRLKMDVLFTCISVCEAVPDLRGAISFSSSLLRTASSGIAPGPQAIDGGPSLGQENQMGVSEALHLATSTAAEVGLGKIEAEYWDDFLVREVEVLPTSNDLEVTKRKRSELVAVKQSLAKKSDGPFIVNQFNARTATASKREHVLVAGESFYFSILIQNLYDMPLNIESLQVDAEGAEVETRLESLSIGAYQTQRLRVIAQASSAGKMKVSSCLVKVRDCKLRRYPIYRDTWRPKEDFRVKRQGLEMITGSKERPLSTASDTAKSTSSSKPVASVIHATIIEAQPRLVVKQTSLIQNNIMVLEGERRRFTVTIQNVSAKPIDFITLAFDDSTLPILKAAVQDRELPAADLYEVEYGIYRKAALSWPNMSSSVRLERDEELDFQIEVLGKVGLSSGVVHFDYASLGSSGTEGQDDIFTRRTSISFTITVNPGIDLVRNDILSLTGPLSRASVDSLKPEHIETSPEKPLYNAAWTRKMLEPVRERSLQDDEGMDHCLLVLDFYNSWTSTLLVMPQIGPEKASGISQYLHLSEPVDPGQSTRFLIPVPRMDLKDPYAPIPSLNPASKRQFVVSTGKVSEAYERSSRDAFWHREELLKQVKVGWLDPATERTGSVELRAVRLSVRMLDALKLEALQVDTRISGSDKIVRMGPESFKVPADEFVAITTKLTNRSAQPIHPLLRLQPSIRNQTYNVALDISKRFAFTGLLQQPLPLLDAGASTEVQLGAVFMCSGEFEVSSSVEEMKIWRPAGKTAKGRARAGSHMDLDVLSTEQRDRRIWFAKEPCRVDVFDAEER